jgi:hypothetical protein
MMENAGLALFVQAALGWLWQWARAPQRIPGWASWTVFGLAAIAGYGWATYNVVESFQHDWRNALFLMVSFVLAARGAASASSDAKAAPKTNSL